MSFLELCSTRTRFRTLGAIILVVGFCTIGTAENSEADSDAASIGETAGDEENIITDERPKPMTGDYYNTFHNLHLQILQSYNPHIRPEIGSGSPLICNFSMVVTHLANVDEDAQTADLNGWIILSWYDRRLAWNETSEYDEINKLLMQQKFIWKPDVHHYNNAHFQADTLVSTSSLVQLFRDGRVSMDPAISLRPYCQFDYTLFPWETHKCAVFIGSWAYRTHELQWQLHPITQESAPVVYSNSNRTFATNWRITNAITALADVEFDEELWHYVNITFYFQRSPHFAANLILIPVSVTALMVSFALLLAAGSEWKLVVILLSLVLELGHFVAIHMIIPQGVISGRPLIIRLCKANIYVTLVVFLVGFILHLIGNRRDEPPYWMKSIARDKLFNLACCLCGYTNEDTVPPRYSMKSTQNRRQQGQQRDPVVVTNQLITVKRSSTGLSADEQDRSAAAGTSSGRNDQDVPLRSWIERRYYGGGRDSSGRGGHWWRFNVALDRLLFAVIAIVYAILWAVYVGF